MSLSVARPLGQPAAAANAVRYAIYYAPRVGSLLWSFGSRWLGRDALTGERFNPFPVVGLAAERVAALTASPRLYGFHATLKPPFHLAPGVAERALLAAVDAFAGARRPFTSSPLELNALGRFLALTPQRPVRQLDRLAAECVAAFDPLRAVPTEGERTRRRARDLTERQEAYLCRWGYPYVMDEFRFHMTLTAPVAGAEARHLREALEPLVAPFVFQSLRMDAICVFAQEEASEPFRLIHRAPFGEG